MATRTKGFERQPQNRNYFDSAKYKLVFNTMPRLPYFANQCNLPGVEMPVAIQSAPLNNIPRPGSGLMYDDFTIDFLVDEDLKNYQEVLYWITGIASPDSLQQIYDFGCNRRNFELIDKATLNLTHDATLILQESNYFPNYNIIFQDMFPYKLSSIDLTSTLERTEPVTARAYFKFSIFNFRNASNKELLNRPIE